jgi:hypothetical protein
MSTSSEALNNAIYALARASDTPEVQRLADDWNTYFAESFWRDLGPLGEVFTSGAETGFWSRYQRAYRSLPADVRATLPAPADVRPDAVRDAADSVVQAGEATAAEARAVARRAKQAALQGVAEARQAVQDIADGVATGVQSTAYGIAFAAGMVALVIYLARK